MQDIWFILIFESDGRTSAQLGFSKMRNIDSQHARFSHETLNDCVHTSIYRF